MDKLEKRINFHLDGLEPAQFAVVKNAILSTDRVSFSDGQFICFAANMGKHRYIYETNSLYICNVFRAFILTEDGLLLRLGTRQSEICSEIAFSSKQSKHTVEELDGLIERVKEFGVNKEIEENLNSVELIIEKN